MTLLSVVHDEWSAAVTDRFVTLGLVDAVTIATPEAEKAWSGFATAKTVRLFTEASVTGGERTLAGVAAVLVWGLRSVPRWLSRATAGAAWFQVIATSPGGVVVADPVQWCLRHGQTSFRLSVHRCAPDPNAESAGVEVPVHVAGLTYQDCVGPVADQLAEAVATAVSAGQPVPDPARGPGVSDPTEPFPVGRIALRVDWSEPAERVARLIRSGIGRTTPAWTYLTHFPVSIGAVEAVEADPCDLPAGTIVRRDATGVTVQTGSGMVRVWQVRDAVGVLPIRSLRPGLRFGIDPEEEFRALWRRVADLERSVQWISDQTMPPVPETRTTILATPIRPDPDRT